MQASIVLAARNAGSTIEHALQPVLQQSLVSFELIIVNDGSEDSTEALLQKASRHDLWGRALTHLHSKGANCLMTRLARELCFH